MELERPWRDGEECDVCDVSHAGRLDQNGAKRPNQAYLGSAGHDTHEGHTWGFLSTSCPFPFPYIAMEVFKVPSPRIVQGPQSRGLANETDIQERISKTLEMTVTLICPVFLIWYVGISTYYMT